MKFVTVMDMWLLIVNIGMMGMILYFGRRLIKTFSRIANVAEKRYESPERARILNMIDVEIEQYEQAVSMGDKESQQAIIILDDLKSQIKRK